MIDTVKLNNIKKTIKKTKKHYLAKTKYLE
jgi:hypothetical protein